MNYASRIEKQLDKQDKTTSFLGEVQSNVNCYFLSRLDDTYKKLQKAASLITSNDSEDHALLLTAIRRAINSVADYFYPPEAGEVTCLDGNKRLMGKEQYLNRLH